MQNNGYWPYVSNIAGSFSKAKWDEIQTTYIYKRKSEQKLVRCEINTKEKADSGTGPGTGQKRDYTWMEVPGVFGRGDYEISEKQWVRRGSKDK